MKRRKPPCARQIIPVPVSQSAVAGDDDMSAAETLLMLQTDGVQPLDELEQIVDLTNIINEDPAQVG